MDECLVAREKSVTAGEQVSFEPALAEMLAQDFHHTTVDAEVDVDVFNTRHPRLPTSLVDRVEPVRGGLIRTEQTKIRSGKFSFITSRKNPPRTSGQFGFNAAGRRHAHGVVVEIRHLERHQQIPAIGVRIHSHTAVARRRKRRELVAEFSALVEQFMRPVAFHPDFELLEMLGGFEVRDWDLMRTPRPFHRLAVYELRSGPALWGLKYDHGPTWPLHRARRGTRQTLDLVNLR